MKTLHAMQGNWALFSRHMKRHSMSLIIRKMKIKTTMRYHLTPVRMPIINKSTNNKFWWACEEKETLVHCWQDSKLEQLLWKTVWRFLKKLKIELHDDLAIPLLHSYPNKSKTLIWKDICIRSRQAQEEWKSPGEKMAPWEAACRPYPGRLGSGVGLLGITGCSFYPATSSSQSDSDPPTAGFCA